jgi:hypothetical protein
VQFVFDVAVFMVGLSAAEMSANWAQWWWWRFNGWARVAASFGGGLCYVAMAFMWPKWPWWNRMFTAMAGSTLLWFVTALFTRPERSELLINFYRRCRPSGYWEPIRRLAGLQPATRLRFPILLGIVIALVGAGAVMAYITGISQLYVGQYRIAFLYLGFMIIAGTLFLSAFPRYTGNLLSAEEREESAKSDAAQDSVANTFGLNRVFSIVCFGAAAVLAFQAIFWQRSAAAIGGCLATAALGLLLRRNRSKKEQVQEKEVAKWS